MQQDLQHAADWRDPVVQLRARAALGKLGLKLEESAQDNDISSLTRDRNTLRKAINLTRERAEAAYERGDEKVGKEAHDEAMALVEFSKRTQGLLDAATLVPDTDFRAGGDAYIVNGRPVRVMRTAKDFRAHYGARSVAGEEFGLADFMRGVAGLQTTTAVRNALSVGTDSAGGYSVPSLVMPEILEALAPASSVLTAGAGILPLVDGAKTFTMVRVDTIPTAGWRSEAGNVSTSDPAFGAVVATPRSLAFQFKVSRELLMDGVGIEQALARVIAQAFAKEMDRVALRGSGTAPEPRGILNTTNVNAVTNGANGTALATIKWSNLLDGIKAVMNYDAPMPTAAIMAPRTLTGFAGLADSTGQPLMQPDLLRGVRFLGTSQIPVNLTVGTSSDCTELYLGDFTKALYAMREQVSLQKLSELYAGTGEIGFVGHARVDVMVQYPRAFAVATGIRP